MASTCGTSLALMQAGVPIKEHVGGVSVGVVTSDDMSDYKLLTDIEGLEDFYGDMDFKVTGTKNGITAIQLDSKLHGVPSQILKAAFRQSREGRLLILEKMTAALPKPNGSVSAYAPKVAKLSINPTRIGELIGPGGKVIKGITESTGVDIDIQDDGTVFLAGPNEESLQQALKMIEDIIFEVEVGEVYEAEVVKLMPFGAFADITPSVSGLIHVSEMADKFIKDPSQIVKEGDKVTVRVKGIDENGKISLSMKGIVKEQAQSNTEEVPIE
jgi:polyribonucleotide nucleotidyltransferase